MASEWPTCRLEELAAPNDGSIAIGPFGSRLKADSYVDEGVALIRGTNLGHGKSLAGQFVFITSEKASELGNANLKPGDLVFPHRGAIGTVGIVPNDGRSYALSTSLMKITLDPKRADAEFFFYFFTSNAGRFELLKNASQVGTPGIATPLQSLRGCIVPNLPLIEQRAIAEILGALDDRIDNLRQINATLEAIATALFKSRFVDFDGLPLEEMQESALGLIPKEWQVSTVGEYFDLTMGQSPPGDTYNETGEGVPFYQGRTDFGSRFPTERVYCTAPTRLAKKDNVLVSVRAPVGDINVALSDCAIGRGVAAVHHEHASFALYVLRSLQSAFKKFESEGTVFGSINKKQFEALQFVAPPDEIVHEFQSIAQPMDARIENNEMQIRTLAHLRDTLLPRLISGQLRVKQ